MALFYVARSDVEEIALFFGNTKSHLDLESADHLESEAKWKEDLPGHRWMVATTGFIQGIDQPNVDTVICLEMPYRLISFVQGGGQAGQSGAPAHVFLINYCQTFIQPCITDIDTAGIEPGTRYIENGSECRHAIISEVMDGKHICCEDLLNAAVCDICNPDHPLVVASKKLLQPVRDTSLDYDIGGWDDTTLALLDESILGHTPPSHVPQHQGPAASHSQPRILPQSYSLPGPSMSLHLDHALYLRIVQDKKAKVAELSAMTRAIGGILDGSNTGYCVIFWAWKNKWQHTTNISLAARLKRMTLFSMLLDGFS
jgi:hypothetical protein